MSTQTNNKIIVITGATSGIGEALALQYANEGNFLVLAARRMEELVRVKGLVESKGAKCLIANLDISNGNSIDLFVNQIFADFGQIDILINNAGISQRSKAEETALSVDRKIMEVNFFGQIQLTKSLWPLICKSGHANIVFISSVVGTFGFPQRSAYAASKHAIEGFVESWMLENQHPNVFFTVVSPGRINTNISYSALKEDGSAHQIMDAGQKKGISAEACAIKIKRGIERDARKIYIANKEMVLVVLRKVFPFLFFKLVKTFKLK